MLAFERDGDIYRMTIDGSETVRLTSTPERESDPGASPDGLAIAYVRSADELWVTDLLGASPRRVLARRPQRVQYASTSGPTWSADGRWLFVARASQGPNEICGWIYRVRASGGTPQRITKGIRLDSGPAPSPDGKRLALSTGDCEPGLDCCSLVVVDLAGKPTGGLARLPALPGAALSPTWSPEGGRLAFQVTDVDSGAGGVYVANRDGSRLRRITPKGLNAEDPVWSPDGELIAFSAWSRSTTYDLYVVRPDGRDLRRITRTPEKERSPSWLPRS